MCNGWVMGNVGFRSGFRSGFEPPGLRSRWCVWVTECGVWSFFLSTHFLFAVVYCCIVDSLKQQHLSQVRTPHHISRNTDAQATTRRPPVEPLPPEIGSVFAVVTAIHVVLSTTSSWSRSGEPLQEQTAACYFVLCCVLLLLCTRVVLREPQTRLPRPSPSVARVASVSRVAAK